MFWFRISRKRLSRRCYILAFVLGFLLLFSLFSLILLAASKPQKPKIVMKVCLISPTKASQSAQDVAKMLEPNKVYCHRIFADNHGQTDHSAKVMSLISRPISFRSAALGAVAKEISSCGEYETQAAVLDNLLAGTVTLPGSKSLSNRILLLAALSEATEMMKLEYQRKVSTLNKQKKRGVDSESLEKQDLL